MGWANCGVDSNGRPIGYAYEGTCDHPGCEKDITRGIDHACGTMHGDNEDGCEMYFCHEHKTWSALHETHVCFECCKLDDDNLREHLVCEYKISKEDARILVEQEDHPEDVARWMLEKGLSLDDAIVALAKQRLENTMKLPFCQTAMKGSLSTLETLSTEPLFPELLYGKKKK